MSNAHSSDSRFHCLNNEDENIQGVHYSSYWLISFTVSLRQTFLSFFWQKANKTFYPLWARKSWDNFYCVVYFCGSICRLGWLCSKICFFFFFFFLAWNNDLQTHWVDFCQEAYQEGNSMLLDGLTSPLQSDMLTCSMRISQHTPPCNSIWQILNLPWKKKT